ncbi:MAG: hypothetical protein FWD23_04085 [Oscillospiraceae bacterium]|nr:hypothetical protein [Oscillospiraceae bacterium]
MNTNHTKSAIIALLLIANVFFAYNIADLNIKSENIPSEMIDNAALILESKGLKADKNTIPSKKPSGMIYEGVYEGVYSQKTFGEIVKSFSGISEEQLEEKSDTLPVGESYAAGDYRFIFSEDNYFKITMIELSYIDFIRDFSVVNPETGKTELEEDTNNKTQLLKKNKMGDARKSDLKSAEKVIRNFFKKYQNQDMKLSFEIVGFDKDDRTNRGFVLINQTFEGVPIDFHTAYIEIQDQKIKYFSGEWYFGEFTGRYPVSLLDSVNILFKCAEIDGNIIRESGALKEMNLEYTVIHHETGKFYLTPSWQLVFENDRKLSYNMITGDKKN